MKKLISLILSLSMMLSLAGITHAEEASIPVYLNGEEMNFPVPAEIINNRTMVPMRALFEYLECEVDWNNSTRSAIATKGEQVIVMKIDSLEMTVNGEVKELDSPPIIKNNNTLVPARAISESIGYDVEWLSDIRTVSISGPDFVYRSVQLKNEEGEELVLPDFLVEKYTALGWNAPILLADSTPYDVLKSFITDNGELDEYGDVSIAYGSDKLNIVLICYASGTISITYTENNISYILRITEDEAPTWHYVLTQRDSSYIPQEIVHISGVFTDDGSAIEITDSQAYGSPYEPNDAEISTVTNNIHTISATLDVLFSLFGFGINNADLGINLK